MADTENPASTPAPAAAPAAPAASPAPSPAPISAPAAPAPAAAPAAPIAEPAPVPAAPEAKPSLLGTEPEAPVVPEAPKEGDVKPEDKKPEEAKPEGDKPEAEKPAEEGKPEEAPPAEGVLPVFEAFKLPEGFTADEKALGEFNKMLGELEISGKPDHLKMQEFGQKAVEMAAQQIQANAKAVTDYYISLHEKTVADEFEALRKDPLIGNGDEKTFEKYGRDMANFLQRNGGTKQEVSAFRKYVDERGVGNSLPIARLLANLKAKIDKYETEKSSIVVGTKPETERSNPGRGFVKALYGGKKS